jgi:dTDP-4-amino-4,6-dideoxygalactose transaminase
MENSNKLKDKIFVTKPFLPPLKEYTELLEDIWKNKQLTNKGPFHEKFEIALKDYLKVEYVSLVNNATTGLIIALRALGIKGDVITTPFSFIATAHSIKWNGLNPIFVDIDPSTCNINPDKIEDAITDQTTAILPVHIYGNPCDTKNIKSIAIKNNLRVIYDGAHAFGVTHNRKSILNEGDLSVLSFHATKLFNTFEGGAIVSHSSEMKKRIDDLKNFGFQNEITVDGIGINGKMNELQAALGLLQLKYFNKVIEKRKRIAKIYREGLMDVNGISFIYDNKGVKNNYAYFPIFIDEKIFGKKRDEVYEELKKHNIYGRRYFYPLISQFGAYQDLQSAEKKNLPVAEQISKEVICLPIYPDLDNRDIERIVKIINTL